MKRTSRQLLRGAGLRKRDPSWQKWDRLHPRLTRRAAWLDHDGPLPLIEGTVIRLAVEHLPSGGVDGDYRALIPHRRKAGQEQLGEWKEDHNASHRRARARIEHAFARMKNWKILHDCRRRSDGVY